MSNDDSYIYIGLLIIICSLITLIGYAIDVGCSECFNSQQNINQCVVTNFIYIYIYIYLYIYTYIYVYI